MSSNDESEHVTRVAYRYQGRSYEAAVLPNGSTDITRDGLFVCRADWNGRALDAGLIEIHPDFDASTRILEALGSAIAASAHRRRSRRGGRD